MARKGRVRAGWRRGPASQSPTRFALAVPHCLRARAYLHAHKQAGLATAIQDRSHLQGGCAACNAGGAARGERGQRSNPQQVPLLASSTTLHSIGGARPCRSGLSHRKQVPKRLPALGVVEQPHSHLVPCVRTRLVLGGCAAPRAPRWEPPHAGRPAQHPARVTVPRGTRGTRGMRGAVLRHKCHSGNARRGAHTLQWPLSGAPPPPGRSRGLAGTGCAGGRAGSRAKVMLPADGMRHDGRPTPMVATRRGDSRPAARAG